MWFRVIAPLLLPVCALFAQTPEKPFLLQKPSVSAKEIVFVYAGDLWIVARGGGDARRLTTGTGLETDPVFSPDGAMVAFSGEYDGNWDLFVVPAAGGTPKRLTAHPTPDSPAGWTPDGKQVLFRSYRQAQAGFRKLYTVPVEGGFPTELPLPMGLQGSFSPDGKQIAYVPIGDNRPPNFYDAWKRYRGGRTSPIWIANLADSSIVRIPREGSNDFYPMWIGTQVYFLSDRSGPVTLFAYDTAKKTVTQVLKNDGLDLKAAAAGPGAIVYEQFGGIHLYDLETKKSAPVKISVTGDFAEVRPKLVKPQTLGFAALSPSGVRAAFQARGEIVTVPAEKGDVRNLTNSTNVMERAPAWSPDGKSVSFFSDESGEYMLHVKPQSGAGDTRKIAIGEGTSFFYAQVWSPDSKKIAYTDNKLNLWCLDMESGKSVKVDTDTYYSPFRTIDPAWSPDSKWITYTKQQRSFLRAVYVYDVEANKTHQISDGMSDARFAQFDKDGKHLYFAASTNMGLSPGWIDMSSLERPVTRSVYVAVLRKDLPSPLAPESDEEKPAGADGKPADAPKPESAKDAKKGPEPVRIDVERIQQRILALPIPAKNYVGLTAGKAGVFYLSEQDALGQTPSAVVHKFDMKTRKLDKVLDAATNFEVSANGEKMLYSTGFGAAQRWFIAGTGAAVKPGEGALKTDQVEVWTEPRAEWKQMYNEVWRLQRDFFYDPKLHGVNLADFKAKYEKYLDQLASRADLNYLFQEMLGNITVGHLYIGGGALPDVKRVQVGLLGADYKIEDGRYRFARIYDGENWNPDAKAPLTQPGVNVTAGEYLLAVDGKELRATDEVYALFEGTAGKSVRLKVGPNADGTDAREVTVVPVASEQQLRYMAWIEDNRRKVDQLSGGKLAYVHLPNTTTAGYNNFNRFLLAQIGRQGAVIDERFNGGGQAADYIVDYLRRPLLNYWSTRYGEDITTPVMAIFGPKAMIVNEFAGSGGDAMPWYFRKLGIGPLIGKRTWGGLVGILGFPQLMDGGNVTAPNFAFWSPKGDWDVENYGVAPDIEVELDPKAVREGRDPQLEKAVEVVLAELKKSPLPQHKRPAYPNYHDGAGRTRW